MKKFLNITKPATLTTATTAGYDYNKFNLTGNADGSPAILYQEAGMDEDEGLWIGKKQGNSVIFDYFLTIMMRYDEKVKDLQVSKDPDGGYLVFTFGPDQRLTSFTDWNVIDVKGFSARNINDMLHLASKENPILFLSTGTDYILIPQ